MKVMGLFVALTLWYMSASIWADNAVNKDVVEAKGTLQPTADVVYKYCPDASAFALDTQQYHWSTGDGNWKSYGLSFAKKLTTFVGAQWDGVNIGQLTCLYSGEPKGTFVVKVVSSHLFYAPAKARNNHWSAPQQGFINCKSDNQKQCPVRPVYQNKEEDLIDQAESLKQSAGSVEPKEYAF